MKVLITGGAGYIGSCTAFAFLNEGYQVAILDNLSTGFHQAVPPGCSFFEGDVRNCEFVKMILKSENIQGVVHLAAKLVVEESILKPIEYYDNNVGGVIALTQACQSVGIDKIVFSSSAAVYSGTEGSSVFEDSVTQPLTPYGQSKLMGEHIFKAAEAYGIRTMILRCFNVAGANSFENLRAQRSKHLVKICAEAACGKRPSVEIYGADYQTYDGTCIRDYLHVEDLARAHVLAFQNLEKGTPGQILNCGSGYGSSVIDVIKAMQKISGNQFASQICPRRTGDLATVLANPMKVRSTLGWLPKFDNLESICRSAFEAEANLVI